MKHRMNFICGLTIIVLICSCKKHRFDQPVLGLLDESKLSNRKGVEGLLVGAYALLDGVSSDAQGIASAYSWYSAASNWTYGSVCGSEAYKGSEQGDQTELTAIETFKSAATNPYFEGKWAAVYAGVQRANTALRVMKKATDINPQDQLRIAAEAKFLRGYYHFEAIKMWNKVPFVDETITYEAGNFHLSNDTLIWPAIENDFKFAIENLQPTQLNAIGRANSWAAKAYLAKVYMFQHKYVGAQALLQDIITNGVNSGGKKYALVNYADNFNPETQNSEETVFSTQCSVNDGSINPNDFWNQGGNGNAGDVLNFPYNNGPAGCCGFFQPSQYFVNHFKTDEFTGLPDLIHFNDADVKNDMGLLSSQPFIPYAGTLDPRLDWTAGRRGIPYLDWGEHPGQDWIRQQSHGGPYSPKKNLYNKAQDKKLSVASYWTNGITANNVNLIRFADVLLWAAEAEIEVGSLEKARDYVNTVRRRAAEPAGWVHTYVDPNDPSSGFTNTPAARYKIGEYTESWTDPDFARKAVRYKPCWNLVWRGIGFSIWYDGELPKLKSMPTWQRKRRSGLTWMVPISGNAMNTFQFLKEKLI